MNPQETIRAELGKQEYPAEILQLTLSVEEWKAILIDIAESEIDNASGRLISRLFQRYGQGSSRDGTCMGLAAKIFRRLGYGQRRTLASALVGLVGFTSSVASSRNHDLLRSFLTLNGLLNGAVDAEMMAIVVQDSNLPNDIRARAASTLQTHVDFVNSMPVEFWFAINVTAEPFLAPAVCKAIAEDDRPLEVFRVMGRVRKVSAAEQQQYLILMGDVLPRLARMVGGVNETAKEVAKSPGWVKHLVKQAAEIYLTGDLAQQQAELLEQLR